MKKGIFGAALDIGTTEIKGSLLDMKSKKELVSGSVPNEQRGFGPDVITRLQFATTRKEGLKELNKRTISAINKLLNKLADKASVNKKDIKRIVAVGNSVMYHLVLMVKPDSLARAPFMPAETKMQEKNAGEMGISAGDTFKFLPNISGFIGSDTLAAILVTEIHKKGRYSLIIDIGTNGEIALGSKDKILVASCACGPAFEGRHMRPGSRAIDIIAVLLNKGAIDKTGRLDAGAGEKAHLTQQDVRKVQVAKAALRAGVEILMSKLALDAEDIHRLYITGKFGTSVNIRNAKNVGLIPRKIPDNKVYFLEEGALSGAKKVLLEPKAEKEISGILSICEHVELHKDKDFQDIFAASMSFQ